jgi:N-acyl-D-aspartate/D-glutamate deacylase
MLDRLIRGGTIMDGTGSRGAAGDVAIKNGRIAGLGGRITESAREVIDADGAIVTPGFVDIHTHYDGQFFWDDKLDSSFSNGVTTVVAGNCGVGFAPQRAEYRRQLIEMMEGVEDIPGIVLDQGLDWKWKSFPDFLDRIAARRYTMDAAVAITHAPLRVFVMGERAFAHETATDDDIAEMARLVREAMAAGAVGFSAGRILEHRSSKGDVIPGTFTEARELIELGRAMGARGDGVFQVVPLGASGNNFGLGISKDQLRAEHELMSDIARASARPLTYVLLQDDHDPDQWLKTAALADGLATQGIDIRPQISARQITLYVSLDGYHPFRCRPSYLDIARLPRAERARAMREPARRRAILSEQDVSPESAPTRAVHHFAQRFARMLETLFIMSMPIDFEPDEQSRLDRVAAAAGRPMDHVLYDLLSEGDGTRMALQYVHNYIRGNLNDTHALLQRPRILSGLGDGGAHLGISCDGGMPTFQLAFWARDRRRGPKLAVESVVRRLTADGAELYGFADRGTLAVGKRADINVIDFDALSVDAPRVDFDLPEGGPRFVQSSAGYLATLVNGEVTRRFDADTGARPGRLIRSGH